MRKTESTEIDGIKLRCTQHAPRAGAQLASKLLKYLAPVLGSMKPDAEVSMSTLSGALRDIMMDMTETELDAVICKSLVGTTAIVINEKGEPDKYELFDPGQIDLCFAGKLPAMLKAVQWALGVNFSSFFDESAPKPEAPPTAKTS